jgi:hypothetical protein
MEEATTRSDISGSGDGETFALIQTLRTQLVDGVQEPYTWSELCSTGFQITVLRPLIDACKRNPSPALFFALLLCRIQFQLEGQAEIATTSLFEARASVCELLCIRLCASYADPSQTFQLCRILTICYNPFAGCASDMFLHREDAKEIQELQLEGYKSASNALEMAILSEAKQFIATPIIQRVVNELYWGRITYLPPSHYSLLHDNYKLRGAELYSSRNRPLLDHQLLRVPAVRGFIDRSTFVLMVALFFAFQREQYQVRVSGWEVLYNLVTLGFCLDEAAQ